MENVEILISIIIPLYNAESYIDSCLESIISQINDKIEIILVNDGSKDNSKDKCEYYCLNNKNIILINQENKGVSYARNTGLKVEKGRYISFVDIDDTIKANAINVLLNEIENEDIDLVLWGIECTQYFNEKKIKEYIITHDTKDFTIEEFQNNLYKYFDNWYFNYTWNKLYKKSIIEHNKLEFDEYMITSEDLLFNSLYLRKCKRVKILSDILYNYRKINGDSLTRKLHVNQYKMQKKAYIELINTLKSNHKYGGLNKYILDNYYIKFAYTIIYNIVNKDFGFSNKEKNNIIMIINNDNELMSKLKENFDSNFNKIFYYCLKIRSILIIKLISKVHKAYNYYVHGWYRN